VNGDFDVGGIPYAHRFAAFLGDIRLHSKDFKKVPPAHAGLDLANLAQEFPNPLVWLLAKLGGYGTIRPEFVAALLAIEEVALRRVVRAGFSMMRDSPESYSAYVVGPSRSEETRTCDRLSRKASLESASGSIIPL